MKNSFILVMAGALFVAGCASKSSDIAASYVSPIQYQDYSCRQLSEEARRVSSRAAQVSGAQDKKAGNDGAAMAVGMIIFWPALFFLKGDSETAAEVARLKGEMEAIESASIRKNCGIQFRKSAPTTV